MKTNKLLSLLLMCSCSITLLGTTLMEQRGRAAHRRWKKQERDMLAGIREVAKRKAQKKVESATPEIKKEVKKIKAQIKTKAAAQAKLKELESQQNKNAAKLKTALNQLVNFTFKYLGTLSRRPAEHRRQNKLEKNYIENYIENAKLIAKVKMLEGLINAYSRTKFKGAIIRH